MSDDGDIEATDETGRQDADGTAVRWFALSAVVIVLDQITKAVVLARVEIADRFNLFPLIDITHRHNTGAAFSFLANQPGWQRWVFIVLALAVSGIITIWIQRLPRRGATPLAIGLALILGGAIGNVIDRINHGYVVDFILMGYRSLQFPFAFNVADAAISLGAVLLLYDSFFGSGHKKEPRLGGS